MLPDVLLFLLPGCKKEKIVKISRFSDPFCCFIPSLYYRRIKTGKSRREEESS